MKKAHLARTAADHRAMGSTVSKILAENEGKTLLETMDDETLRIFMQTEIDCVAYMYKEAQGGSEKAIEFFKLTRDKYLLPNFAYVQEMGRLPPVFVDFDPETEFKL